MHWYGFCHVTLLNGCVTTTSETPCIECWVDQYTSDFVYPDQTFIIKTATLTSSICPFEIEAETVNGSPVYVRERSGILTINVNDTVVYKKKNIDMKD
jgi:hypothetical protein